MPSYLEAFTEFSEVEGYRAPSGTPRRTDTYLQAVRGSEPVFRIG